MLAQEKVSSLTLNLLKARAFTSSKKFSNDSHSSSAVGTLIQEASCQSRFSLDASSSKREHTIIPRKQHSC